MTNFYLYQTITKIEIDCTSFCNAFCGACDRNQDGGADVVNLKLQHLTKEHWKALFTVDNMQHINEVIFNGNFGDFSMHPYIITMLDHLADVKSDIFVNMHTNGAARNPLFWNDLAKVLQRFTKHDIKWGIDGLADTHYIYRRGLDWNKRIANLTAFNDAGGNSIWKAIVFNYNLHQIDDMSALAKQLGCMAFQTNRNRSGTIETVDYKGMAASTITGPNITEFKEKYQRKDQFRAHAATPRSQSISPSSEFVCPYAEEGMIQVDAFGKVWPCCYISGRQIDRNTNFDYSAYDTDISQHTLKDIVNYFHVDLHKAWAEQRYDICNRCAGISTPAPRY